MFYNFESKTGLKVEFHISIANTFNSGYLTTIIKDIFCLQLVHISYIPKFFFEIYKIFSIDPYT